MLINIQFLRFMAAMMVVLHHSAEHVRSGGHGLGLLFGFGQSAGFAGVDIFFVISGFIMAWTTVNATGGKDALSFAKRRAARIYSGYWPFYLIALGLFYMLSRHYLANVHFLSSALLWPTELRYLLIPVSWTLIFEMGFYLMFAILVASTSVRRAFIIKLLTLAVLSWSLYSHFVRHAYDPGRLEAMSVYEQYLAFPFLLEFLLGAILANWLKKHPEGLTWTLLLAGISLFMAGGWINKIWFNGDLIQGYYIIWRVLIFGSASALIVAGVVRLENLGWTCATRFSLLAGGASYAIYLSHTLILDAARRLGLNTLIVENPAWVAQAALICLSALIVLYSMAHYRWVERPLHHAFRRWSKA
jgi:peptidoglycan/LPS O-acetylase OafA/YrhL